MGPRRGRRGNALEVQQVALASLQLQWGRVVEDAETPIATSSRRAGRPASMGPRRGRRGNLAEALVSAAPGGASMGPRRGRRGNQPRGRASCRGPRCFNGAASWKTRKPRSAVSGRIPPAAASMGPRRGRRGNAVAFVLRLRPASCFNGAASWKTRKHPVRASGSSCCGWLQWGRVVEDAETWGGTRAAGVRGRASMGPRRGRRGNSTATTPSPRSRRCFNGAASWKTRKHQEATRLPAPPTSFNGAASWKTRKLANIQLVERLSDASMGPRRGRRGNRGEKRQEPRPVWLQWGRVVEDAETGYVRKGERLTKGASMGPRRGRRGNRPADLHDDRDTQASMGPRRGRRGNHSCPSRGVPR